MLPVTIATDGESAELHLQGPSRGSKEGVLEEFPESVLLVSISSSRLQRKAAGHVSFLVAQILRGGGSIFL